LQKKEIKKVVISSFFTLKSKKLKTPELTEEDMPMV